jgi:hypothetical protein
MIYFPGTVFGEEYFRYNTVCFMRVLTWVDQRPAQEDDCSDGVTPNPKSPMDFLLRKYDFRQIQASLGAIYV